MENIPSFIIRPATEKDITFAETITTEMEESAKARGTGIAKRTAAYLEEKINEGKAVMAFSSEGEWAGFCYIETY